MKVGVLTGGGDAPGLNAAIRAVVRRSFFYGYEVVGIHNGWAGLLGETSTAPLTATTISGILPLGGTMLGTSRTNPAKNPSQMEEVQVNFKKLGLDALVAIGGDDTLSVAARLYEAGLSVVGVPKTMDNDISETDYTIGFDSAVTIVADALDKLHTTASAHHRVMVVEVMGRDAGWVATVGGLAGGADYILVPEEPTSMRQIVEHLKKRRERGKTFSIIVVAEGAVVEGIRENPDLGEVDAFGHVRLDKRGIGERLGREIERQTGFETRVTILGHLQRGGSPSVFDRVLATRLGVAAVDYVREGWFGYMPSLKGSRILPVRLRDAVAVNRHVDLELYHLAQLFY